MVYYIFSDGMIPVNEKDFMILEDFHKRYPKIMVDAAQGRGAGVYIKGQFKTKEGYRDQLTVEGKKFKQDRPEEFRWFISRIK